MRLVGHLRGERELSQQAGPSGERHAGRRYGHQFSAAMLGPGDVEVLQHDSPMTRRRQPDGERSTPVAFVEVTHSALSIAPEAGFSARRAATSASSDSTSTVRIHPAAWISPRGGHSQRPCAGAVVFGTQSQHAMSIDQGLQQDYGIGLGGIRGGLEQHRLVELVDRPTGTFQAFEPPHDRGCDHRAESLVSRLFGVIARLDNLGESGHGLLDEDVAWATRQTRSTSAEATCIDRMLSPPSSKNDASTLTRFRPRIWA